MNAEPPEQPLVPLLDDPAIVRRLCGMSQMQVAVAAGVGVGSVRIYELRPDGVVDARKRRSLVRVYADMRERVIRGR